MGAQDGRRWSCSCCFRIQGRNRGESLGCSCYGKPMLVPWTVWEGLGDWKLLGVFLRGAEHVWLSNFVVLHLVSLGHLNTKPWDPLGGGFHQAQVFPVLLVPFPTPASKLLRSLVFQSLCDWKACQTLRELYVWLETIWSLYFSPSYFPFFGLFVSVP